MQDPIPNIEAQPDPGNILEWHFVITGAPGTPYAGGTYHGKLLFPPDYPFKVRFCFLVAAEAPHLHVRISALGSSSTSSAACIQLARASCSSAYAHIKFVAVQQQTTSSG